MIRTDSWVDTSPHKASPLLSADALSAAVEVVYHDVLTKLAGRGVEGAASIDACQLVYEINEV